MSDSEDMNCRELVELVTGYLENTLPADDRLRLETHLEECPCCAEYGEQMRQTVGVLGRLPEESLSPESERELLKAFPRLAREPPEVT
jgi:anti-sigma factor RsiW